MRKNISDSDGACPILREHVSMHKKLTCEIIGLMLSDALLNTGGGGCPS